MATQKALFLMEPQGSFVIKTRDIPSVAKGELLVKVKAAALNPVDWKIQKRSVIKSYPAILGLDIAGDVVEIGEGVEGFKPSDRSLLRMVRERISGIPAIRESTGGHRCQAASVPLGFATAAVGLFWTSRGAGLNPTLDGRVQFTGQPAVVIGGATSVGQYAIQLLKFAGFSPIVTYASIHHTEFLKSLGATHVLDRKTIAIDEVPAEVKKITDEPVKIIYDAKKRVTPHSQTDPVESKPIHNTSGDLHVESARPFGRVLSKNLTQFLEDGTIKPNSVEELPNGLVGIPDGLQRLRNNQVSGKKLVALPQETA
ncbi:hypothetical protein V5O48_011910 [Marasmius crinis-equi]|uniref:Enoyl reductase (ER) domain-containing protein n=1 Tax=Marasmius crinis-equi TaxID=585013 RepID=A0ABR3F4C3_9AGAR